MPLRALPEAVPCHFKKGEYLIRQDEKIECLYYLVEGTVQRRLLSPEGKEIILSLQFADKQNYACSLVGIFVIQGRDAVSDCFFVAHTNCLCYKIPLESYQIFEKEHKEEILQQLLNRALKNYNDLFIVYSSEHHKNSSALLCSYILEHATIKDDHLIFEQQISKEEWGKHLDIHPVNISKIVSTLTKEGILQKDSRRKYTILDKGYLQTIADGVITLSYRHNTSDL